MTIRNISCFLEIFVPPTISVIYHCVEFTSPRGSTRFFEKNYPYSPKNNIISRKPFACYTLFLKATHFDVDITPHPAQSTTFGKKSPRKVRSSQPMQSKSAQTTSYVRQACLSPCLSILVKPVPTYFNRSSLPILVELPVHA